MRKNSKAAAKQAVEKKPRVEIQYARVAKPDGNKLARDIMDDVFISIDANWRGIGMIPKSGLAISDKYVKIDVQKNIKIDFKENRQKTAGSK